MFIEFQLSVQQCSMLLNKTDINPHPGGGK